MIALGGAGGEIYIYIAMSFNCNVMCGGFCAAQSTENHSMINRSLHSVTWK